MKYLFGDATASPLDRNYIEFLRDLLEFSVSILTAHAKGLALQADLRKRKAQAAAALEQMREAGEVLNNTLGEILTPQTAPETAQCIEAIRAAALAEVKRAAKEVQAKFAGARNNVDGAVEQDRANNLRRLEKLLLRHDLQDSRQWVNLRLDANGAYGAELAGRSASKVTWVIELKIPDGHLFSQPLRLDRLAPQLAVHFPVEAGWVRKSVKLRSYKLGNKYVTEIACDDKQVIVRLRNSAESDEGFDLIRIAKPPTFMLRRLTKGQLSDPYQPKPEDVAALAPVWDELMKGLSHLETCRHSLRAAVFDGTPIQELTNAPKLVEHLVQQITPIVQAISHHSLSPTELVLKRVLDDKRREEIYASKAELFQLLVPLPPELREIFKPLGLHAGAAAPSSPGAAAPSSPGAAAPSSPGAAVPSSPGRADPEAPTKVVAKPAGATLPLPAPLPRPSAPPPPKRKSRRQVPGRKTASPREGDGDQGKGKPADSVEVPLDDVDEE